MPGLNRATMMAGSALAVLAPFAKPYDPLLHHSGVRVYRHEGGKREEIHPSRIWELHEGEVFLDLSMEGGAMSGAHHLDTPPGGEWLERARERWLNNALSTPRGLL